MRHQLGGYGRRLIGACALIAIVSASGKAFAEPVIEVTIDFAKVLKLDRPAETIVIGNPGIADASVEDETTVVLTGKAAGTTNLIVLDGKGEEITNATLRVSSNTRQLTTVFYGSKRQTFSCAPTCELVILVGDEPTVFKNATEQIIGRQQFATGQ
ncbi:MAG: pilus assembly protein N-terminal domain-containing protein [Rhizobiales bacterium]|nr:pilus assembly protein N-terminal domain-containing protein [Hyphomicrobiales bacterium]MDQ3560750.1 pilus assembly protein N-terminal domain-containing protein [Pseudomonadota bacterium]